MQYVTEDLSPVKKKITVTVPAEEADAALAATIALYRTSVTMDGFRKGKVPASIIEKRFQAEISKEATTDLVNVHINEIITEGKLNPVSRIDFDGGDLERGKEYVYSISFDVMPEFELPDYEGFEVDQEEAVVNEDEISAVVDRVRSNMAEIITIGEAREPVDGEIAVIDFEAFDDAGQAIAGISATDFQLTLGEGQTLPDFEALVKSMKSGEEKEGPVSFPADFFNTEFAGRTVTMKAKLHAIKEKKLPELDDAFAQKAGGFENLEKLRDSVRQSYMQSREELNKSSAQASLLDGLLKLVDFPLPESMVESHINMILGDLQDKLERQGKGLNVLGKTEALLREEAKPEAERRARAHIFLLTVARKKELVVSEQEVDLQLRRMAMQSRQDYNELKDYYTRNNLLFALRDRLLADKGMDEIYSHALVKKVPPKKAEEAAAEADPAEGGKGD
ncbi:trigger factor, partial [Desulfovibrio sp. OttesenSCG-928-A18]|nr:trigger factor [Desulfovibrio sp. OttesenSCG-928-A18]